MKTILSLAICCLTLSHAVFAQEAVTLEDYQRVVDLMWENLNNKRIFQLSVRPYWLPDTSGFWYTNHTRTQKTFDKVAFSTLQREPLFDHDEVTRLLRDVYDISARADSLPIQSVRMVNDSSITFDISNQSFRLDLNTTHLTKVEDERDTSPNESLSPDGKWIAFSKEYNLLLRSVETGEEIRLSSAGQRHYEYASWYGWGDIIEGENGERPARFSVNWSPDSKWIQANICDLRHARKMYLLDASVDSLYRPRLLGYYRGSPGDTTMVHLVPVLFDIENRKEIRMDLPRTTHINSIEYTWSEDSSRLYGVYWERGFQKMHLVGLGPSTGDVQEVYMDSSNTNVESGSFRLAFLENSGKAIVSSERSGWNQLYLLDLDTRNLNPITPGKYVVQDILHVDESKEIVYFSASGREEGRNPYLQHVYRIGFDGSGLVLLTPEDANHAVSFSPDGHFFTDNYSSLTQPTVSVLRRATDGAILLEVGRADIMELLETGWSFPEAFVAKGRDGTTDIYGAIWKPIHFNVQKAYPVIDHSYTGPHTFMFPNTFTKALSRDNQALAELGFIVIMVDGLGSAGRSKVFHNWSYKKMGLNLTDHVLAIRELGRRHPWIDTTRVGIFGHSAGGYDAAHGLLQFPEFYKVGVASSADHDFRMEKAWWPEMYMGWPVDSTYHLQSNITMAPRLRGKLLITHGAIDENVNPSATFKLSEALIRADKEFDLLILPSQRHGYSGQHRKYFIKKRWNYFVEHLRGDNPIWNIGW